MFKPDFLAPVHEFSQRTLDFSQRIAVMAVINRTPDSFFDAGSTFDLLDHRDNTLSFRGRKKLSVLCR